ncbi:ATPase [Tritrichomonas foetus]|uniref:histidine kinase n=1 Tax=Tritrichomonas foetus TaxID=1144522 RepID=A0A1J4KRE9_9EUKA|nr:ATPase [Tritrichomonas foetus]|eukprot:OHT12388.1 ATPase [Tritrichomonas foetus]
MLICVILACVKARRLVASVNGYIPSQIQILQTRNTETMREAIPDIYFIEDSFKSASPKNIKKQCQFDEPIPDFFIYKRNDSAITKPLVEIPSNIGGYSTLYRLSFSKNITVALYSSGASFKFSSSPDEHFDGYHVLSSHEKLEMFPFLFNVKSTFHVYSNLPYSQISSVCKTETHFIKIFISLLLILFFIWIVFQFTDDILEINLARDLDCWIVNKDGKMLLGKPMDNVPKLYKKYLHQIIIRSASTQNPQFTVCALKRHIKYQTYIGVFCMPFGSHYFACICEEFLSQAEIPKFNIKFESQNMELKSTPKIEMLPLFNYRPLEIECTLVNNITCQYFLPGTALVPFLPYGRILSVIISMVFKVNSQISRFILDESIFYQLVQDCCKQVKVNGIAFFMNNEIIYRYDLKKVITDEAIIEIFQKLDFNKSPFEEKGLFQENDYCFCYSVSGISIIIQFLKRPLPTFIDIGLPLIANCCGLSYHLIRAKIQTTRFQQLISLFGSTHTHSIFEYSNNYQRVFCKNEIIQNNKQLSAILEKLQKENEMSINRQMLQVSSPSEWASIDSSENSYAVVDDCIKTYLLEDVSVFKRHELNLSKSFSEIRSAMTILNMHMFEVIRNFNSNPNNENNKNNTNLNINDDGEFIIKMQDEKLFQSLNLKAPENLYLNEYIHHKDKEKILLGKSNIRLMNSENKPICYASITNGKFGFIFCVEDMISTRTRLETSDKGIQLATTASSLIFWTVDPTHDTVNSLFMQPTIWDVLSVGRDTNFSRFVDFIYEEDKQLFIENYRALTSEKIHQWNGFVRLLRISGTYEWHRLVFTSSRTNTLHCLALNVNTQKENELKLRETHRLRDLLLSSGKLTLWKFNDDHEPIEPIHHFDPNVMKVVEMNWTFVENQVREDYRDEFYETMQRAYECDECFAMSVPLLLDEEIWVSVRGKARTNSRQVFGVCIDITELRKAYSDLEKEKRRAEEANKQKTVFLANMSHEIRTPMNGIFGILDVLALRNLSSEQKQLVELIRASSTHLMKLLDDTLNLSKIEQGDIESNPTIFNFGQLIEPICVATASRATLNNIKFNVIISKDFPFLVFGDSQLLIQILNNLVSNALKFTKNGHIDVILEWSEEGEMEFLTLQVADSGIGITKEQKKVIFHRFEQAEASTARYFGGTGLGLALVQEIARFLGGSVKVKSKYGQGTRFIVDLPFESIYRPYSPVFTDNKKHIILISTADEVLKQNLLNWIPMCRYEVICFENVRDIEKYQPEVIFIEGKKSLCDEIDQNVKTNAVKCAICKAGEAPAFKNKLTSPLMPHRLFEFLKECRYRKLESSINVQAKSVDQTKRRILVVEDNKTNQFVMSKILSSCGCTFEIADNGKEAISKLDTTEKEFDMIFMDCQMPVLDGITATRIIRKSNKSYSNIPIVALTASAVEGDEETCLNAGMDAYLAKPVRYQQVINIIKRFT